MTKPLLSDASVLNVTHFSFSIIKNIQFQLILTLLSKTENRFFFSFCFELFVNDVGLHTGGCTPVERTEDHCDRLKQLNRDIFNQNTSIYDVL